MYVPLGLLNNLRSYLYSQLRSCNNYACAHPIILSSKLSPIIKLMVVHYRLRPSITKNVEHYILVTLARLLHVC